jgi:hypothetical protein
MDVLLTAGGASYLEPDDGYGQGGGSAIVTLVLYEAVPDPDEPGQYLQSDQQVRMLYAPVPEPSAMLLMASGLMLIILRRFLTY